MYGAKYGPEICTAACIASRYRTIGVPPPVLRERKNTSRSGTCRSEYRPRDGSLCRFKNHADMKRQLDPIKKMMANAASSQPLDLPVCSARPPKTKPASVQ